jgi:hypothetical protein
MSSCFSLLCDFYCPEQLTWAPEGSPVQQVSQDIERALGERIVSFVCWKESLSGNNEVTSIGEFQAGACTSYPLSMLAT